MTKCETFDRKIIEYNELSFFFIDYIFSNSLSSFQSVENKL